MRKLLVLQHVAHEILGTLNPLFKDAGFRMRYVNFGRRPDARPTMAGYGGLVVLGGPMSANDTEGHPHLVTELRLIEEALAKGVPILGICLGAQLLARVLGAQVRPSPEKEIGWYEVQLTPEGTRDRLLRHIGNSARIFQWHGETFDIPAGAVHLATSTGCPNQAFRYGDRAYGLQFHLEVDQPMIERWLNVPAMREEIAALNGRIDPEAIRRETEERIGSTIELSRRVFSEFVGLFSLRRRRVLPSR